MVPSSPEANNSWAGSGKSYTVNTFISAGAINAPDYRLTADSIEGVDWGSSNTATVSNVAGITMPLLIMSMTAHYWVVPSEMYYLAATKSTHKTLAYVFGALHTFTPRTVCGIPANQIGDTVTETFNYVANCDCRPSSKELSCARIVYIRAKHLALATRKLLGFLETERP